MELNSLVTSLTRRVQNTHILFVKRPTMDPSGETGGNAQGDGQGVCDRLNSSICALLQTFWVTKSRPGIQSSKLRAPCTLPQGFHSLHSHLKCFYSNDKRTPNFKKPQNTWSLLLKNRFRCVSIITIHLGSSACSLVSLKMGRYI